LKAFQRVWRFIDISPYASAAFASLFVALLTFPILGSTKARAQAVSNAGIYVSVDCSGSTIMLTHIKSVVNGADYLSGATPLLSFSVNDFDATTNYYNGTLSNLTCTSTGNTIAITANANDSLALSITISPDGTYPVVIVSTQVTYEGPSGSAATCFLRAMLPNIQAFSIPNSAAGNTMAMVPQMIGGLLPLSQIGPAAQDGLGASYDFGNAPVKPSTFGLPTNLNVLEMAEAYDGSSNNGGGLFFTDLDGDYSRNIPPLQFQLTNTGSTASPSYQIAGYWTALLKLNQTVTLPRLAIGVHPSGDWHYAVDYYVNKRSQNWSFPDTPSWLRNAGAIYELGVAGGGSFFNTFPATPIDDPDLGIELFACSATVDGRTTGSVPNQRGHRCLLDVYNDAQKLGSSVIYLTSWWEPPYSNKGDWIVRSDLGGAAGLQSAVNEIHKKHGQVILYIEPYIALQNSKLVKSGPGNSWEAMPWPPIIPTSIGAGAGAICQYAGPPSSPDKDNDCMAIPDTQWQDYLINAAANVMTATSIDGFFLDSWGWQMNWPVESSAENVTYTSQQWTAAALRFVDRFRAKIRNINKDKNVNPVVMGENNTGQLSFHWDGGSAVDLSYWDGHNGAFNQNGGRLFASPIRYAMPNAIFFANGSGLTGANGSALNSVNQIIASGHNLALGPFFLLNVMGVGTVSSVAGSDVTTKYKSSAAVPYCSAVSQYIQSLVQLRTVNTNTQDALVYGKQLPMPPTSSSNIVAFMYQGQTNQVVAVVNNGSTAVSPATVKLDPSLGTGSWISIVPPSSAPITEASDGTVTLATISAAPSVADQCAPESMGGLVILSRASCPSSACVPTAYGNAQEAPLMNEDFKDGMSNWTDWTASGGHAVASGRWSTSPGTYFTTGSLQVESQHDLSLLFYDSFGGGDFTYSGGITFDSLPIFGLGGAGLSFRLSDRPQNLDAGNTGYDVVLTSQPFYSVPLPGLPHIFPPEGPYPVPPPSPDPGPLLIANPASGSVQLLKGPTGKILAAAPLNVTSGHTYQLSISANTTWTAALPSFPSSTTLTVYVDGVRMFSATDNDSPYFSGRFGVNASYVSAHFTCLQANDSVLPPYCGSLSVNPPVPLPLPH
jgi:hypothetical protein